jgi:hypothetical protein
VTTASAASAGFASGAARPLRSGPPGAPEDPEATPGSSLGSPSAAPGTTTLVHREIVRSLGHTHAGAPPGHLRGRSR